jgi:outer membrane protein assembly factor BamB
MHRSLLVLFLAVCFGATNLLFAADWPAFLGPAANGISPEKLANTDWRVKAPTVLWHFDLGDGGYAGPSVADGKVFVIDHQGKNDIVRALDLNTGAEVWHYTYTDTNSANYGFARSTPVIDHARIYALSRLGVINCLDEKTGTLIWTRDLMADFGGHRPGWDLAMSPLIDKEKLILSAGGADAAVVALNKTTGATIWKGGGSDVPGYATPVRATINNTPQYVFFTVNGVMGVNADSGNKLWSYPWKTGADVNATTPIVLGNSVFISSGYGHGAALLDITQNPPRSIWENKAVQSRFTCPIYADGYLYTTTESNHLMCVNPLTGEIKWQQPGFEWGGLVGIDGMLIVGDGKTGEFALVKMTPESYQEFGRITPLGGQSWTAPIIANGKLIVCNTKAIACLNLN